MDTLIYISILASAISWVNASDCNVTIELWKNFGRLSNEDPNDNLACCQMQGVTCVGESVVKINWTDQSLVGTILPEIGHLTELSSLTLSLNSISGTIPPEIGDLSKLVRLDLGGNQLSGWIPSSIGQLRRLTTLSFYNNQLTGSIPSSLANCKELRVLWLGKNRLNGNIPPELEMLKKLESLIIRENQFSVTISSCLINGMTSLTSVDMSNNPNLKGAVWFASKKVLLDASNTNLTDCSSNKSAQARCSTMKCIQPVNVNVLSWWIVFLLVLVWVIILGILGTCIYAEYAKRKLYKEEDLEKSEYDEEEGTETDNESVITKLDGFQQNGRRNTYNSRKSYYSTRDRDTIASKSTTFSSFFRRSQYGGEFDQYENKKPYTVVQPHTAANDDEIELIPGETVIILEQFEDGWAFGLNQTKDETGVFPLVCLK